MKVFREKREAFGNKADFAGMAAIMRYYAKQGKCRANGRGGTGGTNSSTDLAIVLLAGANKGESTSQVLRECEAKMHIFEIQAKLFEKQEKRLKTPIWFEFIDLDGQIEYKKCRLQCHVIVMNLLDCIHQKGNGKMHCNSMRL